MKNSIVQLFIQLCLIVFSVVLGIYLSERIEERKNDKAAEELLSKVKSEINENRTIIEEWSPYHAEMARMVDSLVKEERFINAFIKDKSIFYSTVVSKGTFMSRFPSSDAWDIAKAHPLIVNFDYDQVLMLSKIYNQQKSTFEPAQEISKIVFAPDFNAKEKAVPNLQEFHMNLREIASREFTLIEYLNEAETVLDLKSE